MSNLQVKLYRKVCKHRKKQYIEGLALPEVSSDQPGGLVMFPHGEGGTTAVIFFCQLTPSNTVAKT